MGWIQTAKPGDKIVAIKPTFRVGNPYGQPVPEHNKVYTIEYLTDDADLESGVAIALIEIPTALYCSLLFRPIQPKSTETGMKVFKGILNGQRVPEVA